VENSCQTGSTGVMGAQDSKKKPYSPLTLTKLTQEQAQKLVMDRKHFSREDRGQDHAFRRGSGGRFPCARVLAAMLSKLTRASAPTATLAAIFSIFANRIMLVFVPFCEDVSATTQCPTLSLPMAADSTVQTMWTRRCRGHADRSSPRSNWEPQSKIWFSVHSEVWQLSHADAGGSPLLLRHAATERPNSTHSFAVA